MVVALYADNSSDLLYVVIVMFMVPYTVMIFAVVLFSLIRKKDSLHSINVAYIFVPGTIACLVTNKQPRRLKMFMLLNCILWLTIVCWMVFSASTRWTISEHKFLLPETWKTNWWTYDAGPTLFFFIPFWAIAYIWQPSPELKRCDHLDSSSRSLD
jgi:hypothetical protein